MRSQRTFELFDRFMDDHVSLEFILSIERFFTRVALERFVSVMYQHVHLEVLFSFERLVAY